MGRNRGVCLVAFSFISLSMAFSAACVGSDPEATSPSPDAGSSDTGAGTDTSVADSGGEGGEDAGEAGPPCDLTKPWTLPVQVAGVNIAIDEDTSGRLTSNLLALYFASNRRNGSDTELYYSTRLSVTDGFGAGKTVPVNVDGGVVIGLSPAPRADDLAVVFETAPNVIGDVQRSIKVMRRTSPMASFDPPEVLPNITGPGRGDPFLTADGTRLYFVIDVQHHIFTAKANGDGFDPATEVNGLATPSDKSDAFPVASNDGLTLFFSSDRNDAQSKGGFEIWMATRKSLTDDFSSPVPVPSLNSDGDDSPSWLSPDQCTIYLTSNRVSGGDTPHMKIFRSTRQQ